MLRVVVRDGNVDLLDLLFDDLVRLVPELQAQTSPLDSQHQSFHH